MSIGASGRGKGPVCKRVAPTVRQSCRRYGRSPRPAPSRPRGAPAGRCGCWRTRWWKSASSSARATPRLDARSKKPSQAASPATLGHPAEGQQRLRSGTGRCARGLHAASRSGPPAGVPGRDLQATYPQEARADPVEAGTPARVDCEYEPNGTANPTCSCRSRRSKVGATSR